MDLRQAAQLALSAIEGGQTFDYLDNTVGPALSEALAGPDEYDRALRDCAKMLEQYRDFVYDLRAYLAERDVTERSLKLARIEVWLQRNRAL